MTNITNYFDNLSYCCVVLVSRQYCSVGKFSGAGGFVDLDKRYSYTVYFLHFIKALLTLLLTSRPFDPILTQRRNLFSIVADPR